MLQLVLVVSGPAPQALLLLLDARGEERPEPVELVVAQPPDRDRPFALALLGQRLERLAGALEPALAHLGLELLGHLVEPLARAHLGHLCRLRALEHLAAGAHEHDPLLLPRQPAPARDDRVERDPPLVAHRPQARRAPGEAAHAAHAGDAVRRGSRHLRERGAPGEERLGERRLEDAAAPRAPRRDEPRPARPRGPGRVEHEPDALATPALLELGRELHLPVAARRRLDLALVGPEPAADEAPPFRRLGRGLAARDLHLRQHLAVRVRALSVRSARRGLPGRGGALARWGRRRAHERSSSCSPALWNNMLWLSRCCW